MVQAGYCFAVELITDGGVVLGRFPVRVDWSSAVEWARFTAIRRGKLAPVMASGRSRVEPVWHPRHKSPYVSGFTLTIFGDDSEPISMEIPTTYLQGVAKETANQLTETGKLKAGDRFYFRALALPADGEEPPLEQMPFSVCEVPEPLPLNPGCLDDQLNDALLFGYPTAGDLPVFIPMSVLREASALTRRSGENETGGILIGHLCRGVDSPEIFAKVTAQMPARHAQSGLTKLTFTADTWASVQAAISLRRRNEIHLGWWHSHSYLKTTCKDCVKRAEGACTATASFMSAEDVALHLTCFPRAFSTALVISDSPCAGLSWELFGWRQGMVVPRAFHILGALELRSESQPAFCVTGGDDHAKRSK